MKVCGKTVTGVNSWEGGDSLRDLSAGLGFINEQMSVLDPPTELAEWHHAQIAFAGIFKETVDDFLEGPGDQTEDDFVISLFFTVGPHFEPVEKAIAGMGPDLRARMVEAGCIDEETTYSISAQPEIQRQEIPVGGSASGALSESEGIANLQVRAEMGQKYLIEVTWEGLERIRLLVKDPPDPVVSFIDQANSSARERERWHSILLLAQGWTAAATAEMLDRDPHAIGRWTAAFDEGGPRALIFEQTGGSPPRLSRRNRRS